MERQLETKTLQNIFIGKLMYKYALVYTRIWDTLRLWFDLGILEGKKRKRRQNKKRQN